MAALFFYVNVISAPPPPVLLARIFCVHGNCAGREIEKPLTYVSTWVYVFLHCCSLPLCFLPIKDWDFFVHVSHVQWGFLSFLFCYGCSTPEKCSAVCYSTHSHSSSLLLWSRKNDLGLIPHCWTLFVCALCQNFDILVSIKISFPNTTFFNHTSIQNINIHKTTSYFIYKQWKCKPSRTWNFHF